MWKHRWPVLVLLALLVAGWIVYGFVGAPTISRELSKQIAPGMNENEVEMILGGAAHEPDRGTYVVDTKKNIKYTDVRYWHGVQGSIGVYFDSQGGVGGAWFLEPDPKTTGVSRVLRSFRRWLRLD